MFLAQAMSEDHSRQKAVNDAAIGRFNGKGSDEKTLLSHVLGTFNEGDLVLGDAFMAPIFS